LPHPFNPLILNIFPDVIPPPPNPPSIRTER
jgi:hypothetical protein